MLCFEIKLTYLIALLYAFLFAHVSGHFEAFLAEHQNSANSPKMLQNGLRHRQTTKNTTRQLGMSILFKNITFFLSFKKNHLHPIQAFVNNCL